MIRKLFGLMLKEIDVHKPRPIQSRVVDLFLMAGEAKNIVAIIPAARNKSFFPIVKIVNRKEAHGLKNEKKPESNRKSKINKSNAGGNFEYFLSKNQHEKMKNIVITTWLIENKLRSLVKRRFKLNNDS